MAGSPDENHYDGIDSTLAFKLGSWEARLVSIEESLKKSNESSQRLEDRLESLVDKFEGAIKGLDNRYAQKEGCLREKSVTRREVAVIATGIGLFINMLALLAQVYFH